MKIPTSEVIKNLKGKPYTNENEDLTVGLAIAEVLGVDATGGKMKMYILARRCMEESNVEVDAADFALIKKAVEESKAYGGNNIILGSVLVVLDGVREEKEAKEAKE